MSTEKLLSDINNIILKNRPKWVKEEVFDFDCDYQIQAIDFLIGTKTELYIDYVGTVTNAFGKTDPSNRYKYLITMIRGDKTFTFDFHGSFNDFKRKKYLTYGFYEVLACLDSDTPESFDDFCSEFGYEFKNESEYIAAKGIHLECLRQATMLLSMYSEEELNTLNNIQ